MAAKTKKRTTKKAAVATNETLIVDGGNGGTNAIYLKNDGKRKRVYFPSVRAEVNDKKIGFAEMEMDYDYVTWGGVKFVVGDEVVRVNRHAADRHRGKGRYGNELQEFLVANAALEAKMPSGTYDLVMFAPPGMFEDARERIVNRFQAQTLTIEPKRGKAREYTFENVRVLPEGIGAVICLGFDESGEKFQNAELMRGRVIVIDIGTYTLDVMNFENGRLNMEPLPKSTWEDSGVASYIIEPLLAEIRAHNEDFAAGITYDVIDMTIRDGVNGGDWMIESGGQQMSIEAAYNRRAEAYASWIANNIIDTYLNKLDGVNLAVMIGGGHHMTGAYFDAWGYSKLVNYRKVDTLKKVAPEDINAEGGARDVLRRQLKEQSS